MNATPLPALPSGDPSAWDQALYAFLVEKGNRSGSHRTVESYSRMLWPFFAARTPDRVKPPDVLAYAHGIGLSGRTPSSATIGARIACLSSFYRFLIRMSLMTANPCDAVERPRTITAPARGEAMAQSASAGAPITLNLRVTPGVDNVSFELTAKNASEKRHELQIGRAHV